MGDTNYSFYLPDSIERISTMKTIIWDESFSVGVEVLDKQHQQIVAIINRLIDEPAEGFGSDEVARILADLTKFVHYHFQIEEQLLAEHGYPDLKTQQAEHKEFRIELAGFCLGSMKNHTIIPINILLYLKEWWVDHILVKDMKYRSFLAGRIGQ
jgi:hemerythrin-like metal-binding protein